AMICTITVTISRGAKNRLGLSLSLVLSLSKGNQTKQPMLSRSLGFDMLLSLVAATQPALARPILHPV
ncbi:MAG: hypothetical protein ACE5OS_15560, partial [Anaerolineae bacterium]